MRFDKDMIMQDEISRYFNNFSQLLLLERCGDKKGEFVFSYWGTNG